jgi:chemotaxis signal transduction protein
MNHLHPDSTGLPILTFNVGGDEYGLPIEDVLEVAAMVELRPLHDAPPEILGIADRHGSILPLLDLGRLIYETSSVVTSGTLFIVAGHEGRYIGLVVDDVYQVEYIHSTQLSEASITGKYIRGIINHKSRVIQIISLMALSKMFQTDTLAEDKG